MKARKDPSQQETGKRSSWEQVEHLVHLIKNGDASSLREARQQLDRTQAEIASKTGITEAQLEKWETGEIQPSRIEHARWKLELSHYVDGVIAGWLGTYNMDVVTEFWELMWLLVD